MGGAYQGKTYKISELSDGARMILLENPYSVLGISCKSTLEEAKAQAEKLQKLISLQAADIYTSNFDLPHVEKPTRDINAIETAVPHLEKPDYCWSWFSSPKFVKNWQEADHSLAISSAEHYDAFLADYLAALIIDPKFHDKRRWQDVLAQLDKYLDQSKQELYETLTSRLRRDFLLKLGMQEVLDNFCQTILHPLLANLQYADGKALTRVLPDLIRFYHMQEDFQEQLEQSITSWSDKSLEELRAYREKTSNNPSSNDDADKRAVELDRLLVAFFDDTFPAAKELISYFEIDYVNAILSKFAGTVYRTLVSNIDVYPIDKACMYISKIYSCSHNDLKKEIKSRYPLEKLQIPDSEFTGKECKKIAWTYNEDGTDQPELYFLWMKRAADRGDPGAMNAIGCRYSSGKGCAKDKVQAAEWFRKAAYAGDAYGWSNLALYHKHGYGGLEKDEITEFNCRLLAFFMDPSDEREAELKKYNAYWKVMFSEQFGFAFGSDEVTLSALADEGNSYALCYLGFAHYYGYQEFEEDEELSKHELLAGSLEGCPWASPLLSAFYDIDDAEADTGESMYLLAEDYFNCNNELAFYWYRKAAAAGYTKAYVGIGNCYTDAVGTGENEEAAAKYYALAVIEDDENTEALYRYASALYFGSGTERNIPRAKELFKKCAELGDEDAAEFLGEYFAVTEGYEITLDECVLSILSFDQYSKWYKLTFTLYNGSWNEYHILARLCDDNNHYSSWQRVATAGEYIDATITVSLFFTEEAKYLQFEFRDDTDDTICFTDDIEIGPELFQPAYYTIADDVKEALFYGFKPRTLYQKDGIHVILSGLNLAMNVPLLAIHVQNDTEYSISLWLVNLYLDEERVYDYVYLGKCNKGRESGYSIPLPQFTGKTAEHSIKLNIQIDDLKDFPLAATGPIEISADLKAGTMDISRAWDS